MKITKICIFTIVAFAAYACAKSDSVDTSSVTPETLVPVENDEIQCINGTLHFSSGEVCLNTLESLTSEESLHAFEKAHNFTSWRSFTDSMLDDIIACETPEEYAAKINAAMKAFPKELPERAYQDVLEIYNTEAMKKKYIEFYNRIIQEDNAVKR